MLLAPTQGTEAASPEAGVPAGLFYSSDDQPGTRRVRSGEGFDYIDAAGRRITDEALLARIRKLAIPPAYESVWICSSPDGHLQATGRDARGRKQYRYHERWREERDTGKFERMPAFAAVLPALRRKVRRHLEDPHHSRERVLATVVWLLDATLVRVGNDQYAKENGSFGLTTLRNRHARIAGGCLKLAFRGKSGVLHSVEVKDPRVLKVVKHCLHLPGQELFQWADDGGAMRSVNSSDVNDYLNALSGERFTAKDFRTWHGSVLALDTILRYCKTGECFTLKQLLAVVAARLGNTPAVCRKAYIHPEVLALGSRLATRTPPQPLQLPAGGSARGLAAAERRLVAFLAQAQ
jgi:DNA topoisomerase-1